MRLIKYGRKSVFALVLLTALGYAAKPTLSDEFTERRIMAGAKIFRALLAADVGIGSKTDVNGDLRLCLLYIDDTANAEKAEAMLANRDDSRIRSLQIHIEMSPFDQCISKAGRPIAGIFITQRLNADQLQTLMAFANERHLVVFSPFEGDVERGVHSGIAVEARVRPYLNATALRAARVRLKSFFMKVAKLYEEKV